MTITIPGLDQYQNNIINEYHSNESFLSNIKFPIIILQKQTIDKQTYSEDNFNDIMKYKYGNIQDKNGQLLKVLFLDGMNNIDDILDKLDFGKNSDHVTKTMAESIKNMINKSNNIESLFEKIETVKYNFYYETFLSFLDILTNYRINYARPDIKEYLEESYKKHLRSISFCVRYLQFIDGNKQLNTKVYHGYTIQEIINELKFGDKNNFGFDNDF